MLPAIQQCPVPISGLKPLRLSPPSSTLTPKPLFMKKINYLFLIVLLYPAMLFSQDNPSRRDTWKSRIHIEGGALYPEGQIRENIAIRQNVSSYYIYQSSRGYITSETYGPTFGLRWEFFNPDLKLGISSGLRYTGFKTEISGSTSVNADYFYLRYYSMGSETRFARMKSISETSQYLIVPLEVSYSLFEFKDFGLFAKGGAEFSLFNLRHDTDVEFQEESMDTNSGKVLESFGEPSKNFFAGAYASAGINYSSPNGLVYQAEFFFPSLFLSKDNFVLTEIDNYSGFRLSVIIPLLLK